MESYDKTEKDNIHAVKHTADTRNAKAIFTQLESMISFLSDNEIIF